MAKGQRGFTLIELMIVCAIIAILAGILIPNFLHARAQSQTASCEGNLKNIATALEEYAIDNGGKYPPANAPVDTNLLGGAGNPYLANAPSDPAGGSYHYVTPGNGVCTAADAYKIVDGNNHETDTLANLPDYNGSTTGIRYCQSSGLHAALITW